MSLTLDNIREYIGPAIFEALEYIGAKEDVTGLLNKMSDIIGAYDYYYTSSEYWHELNKHFSNIESVVTTATNAFHDRMVDNQGLLETNLPRILALQSKLEMRLPPGDNSPKKFYALLNSVYKDWDVMEHHHYHTSANALGTAILWRLYDSMQILIKFSNTTESTSFNSTNTLLITLLNNLKRIQGLGKAILPDEPSRTALLANFMDNYIDARDESRWGSSSGEIKLGELDIKIINEHKEVVAIIEALNLDSVDKSRILEHYERIDKYDANGNAANYLIYFANVKDISQMWLKIKTFFLSEVQIELKDFDDRSLNQYTPVSKIKIAYSIEKTKSNQPYIYHILVQMN